ncbi:MAG TPA: YbaK/EbsC family protein [Candidatus Cybelea sp.]|nr:YbaK/EbsC family protein [Candidatus Cybelea sp.]
MSVESGRSSVERVRAALAALGLDAEIKEFSASTRTAADAAAAIGCTVAQIAKSLVFRARPSGRAVLVIASGVNRVDEAKLAAALGESIGKADAEFVRAETGFAIGGVAPVGHGVALTTFIDADLMGYGEIWAAAGSPNAVFRLTPRDLVRITGGKVADIKAESPPARP